MSKNQTQKSSKVPEPKSSDVTNIFNPHVPFEETIGETNPGRVILISGYPNYNASRMTFNLVMSTTRDIALHIDVRFNYGVDQNVVVRNSKKEGESWGTEETAIPFFPFSPNIFFEMKITAADTYFKVDVNDKHVFEYVYRIPPLSFVDTLKAFGDVTLAKVTY